MTPRNHKTIPANIPHFRHEPRRMIAGILLDAAAGRQRFPFLAQDDAFESATRSERFNVNFRPEMLADQRELECVNR
jgi:hypothetical protein